MEKSENLTWLDRVSFFLTHHRFTILIVILIITAIFLYGAFRIRGEVILQDMLPYDHPYLKLHNRFSEVFGSGGSTVVIALRTKKGIFLTRPFLTKFQKMTNEVLMWMRSFEPDSLNRDPLGESGQGYEEGRDQRCADHVPEHSEDARGDGRSEAECLF
jgi:predicted RND superfamily exporter protein